jgi:hypothetical protein
VEAPLLAWAKESKKFNKTDPRQCIVDIHEGRFNYPDLGIALQSQEQFIFNPLIPGNDTIANALLLQ